MTFRICTAALLAMLTACATEPAYADAFHDQLPGDPARPGWRPPAARAYVPMAGNHYDFDPRRGPLDSPSVEDAIWLSPFGTFNTWGQGAAEIPLPPPPPVVTPCRPPAAVPGPLPVLGLGAAFAYSRKLRQRIR